MASFWAINFQKCVIDGEKINLKFVGGDTLNAQYISLILFKTKENFLPTICSSGTQKDITLNFKDSTGSSNKYKVSQFEDMTPRICYEFYLNAFKHPNKLFFI